MGKGHGVEAKETSKDCLRSEITSNALAKIQSKNKCDSGGTSALGDNFGFCQQLKSNLLRTVVFPPSRISKHLSGEMFTFRRRWKFVRNRRCETLKIFFTRAKSSSGKQVEMSGNDQTARRGNWSFHDGRLDILLATWNRRGRFLLSKNVYFVFLVCDRQVNRDRWKV